MALRTFWAEVAVRNPFFQGRVSHPDRPRIKSQELDAALSEKNEWQFVGPIRGFAEADFDFLPDDTRRELAVRVQEFNVLAPKLRTLVNRELSNEGAIEEMNVANRARPLLRDIVLLLEQDRHADPDAFVIGKQVERLAQQRGLPEVVRELRFSTSDPFGDLPVLNITAVLNEAELKTEAKFLEQARLVHATLEPIAEEVAPEWFAHIMCRTDRPLTEYELRPYEDEAVPGTRG